MDTNQDATYIFWLSLILIAFAYWAGAIKVIPAIGQQLVNLIQAAQGRLANGQFAGYPK